MLAPARKAIIRPSFPRGANEAHVNRKFIVSLTLIPAAVT